MVTAGTYAHAGDLQAREAGARRVSDPTGCDRTARDAADRGTGGEEEVRAPSNSNLDLQFVEPTGQCGGSGI